MRNANNMYASIVQCIIIIQTYMKGKKNRKQLREASPCANIKPNSTIKLFHVKFDVSANDISCFISKTKTSQGVHQKSKLTISSSIKQQTQHLKQVVHPPPQPKLTDSSRARSDSPDLIRQSSNTILEKIQQKGIRFDWREEQQSHKQGNGGQQNEETENLFSVFDSSFQKSFASTNDYPLFQDQKYYWKNIQQKEIISILPDNPYTIQLDYICFDWRTTLMIRNIPNRYTVNQLAQEIDTEHADTYDFLYLPCDPKNLCNVGYGFINFVNTKHLRSFYEKFYQYVWKKYRSQKICSLTYARLQGLSQLIEHFSNSKVLNQKQKKYRPIIKMEQIHKMVLEQQKK